MIKLFLIFLILISCILIGVLVSSYYKKRKLFFSQLLSFIQFIKTYVCYGNEKLLVIIDKFDRCSSKTFDDLTKKYKELLIDKIKEKEFKDYLNENLTFLRENEKNIVFELFISLGNFDGDCEINNLEIYKNTLENLVKTSTNESNKFSPFAIKFAVLVGSLLFIIFI